MTISRVGPAGLGERGSAVAEFAVAMPAVLLVFATLLGAVEVVGLQLQGAAVGGFGFGRAAIGLVRPT